MDLTIMVEPCEEGGYHVWAPALPRCRSEGETEEEAIANMREAISLYLAADACELPRPPARGFRLAF